MPRAESGRAGLTPGVFIDDVRLVEPGRGVTRTSVRFSGGLVAAHGEAARPGDTLVKGEGRLLTPGLVDIHVHGVNRFLFGLGAENLLAAAGFYPAFGTTTILPTVTPKQSRGLFFALEELAAALDRVEGVRMPGFHLEGPFSALPGAGVEVLPGDTGLLDELLAACGNRVRAMSVSPDTPGIIPVIEHLREKGVAPFITHTRADLAQSLAAIAAGARHATHFYDVFPLPPERDGGVRPPGAVEAFLAGPELSVDFIADGCHVDPFVIAMAARLKGCGKVAVITDANFGAGLPPGEYRSPGGLTLKVGRNTGTRVAEPGHPHFGALTGSSLTMNVAMANVLEWLDAPPEETWQMGTTTPAAAAGLENAGRLDPGCPADAVLWQEDLTPAVTWLGGKAVFESGA